MIKAPKVGTPTIQISSHVTAGQSRKWAISNKFNKQPSILAHPHAPDLIRILKAFHKIKSRKARQLLVLMAEEFAEGEGDTEGASAKVA